VYYQVSENVDFSHEKKKDQNKNKKDNKLNDALRENLLRRKQDNNS